MLFGGIFWYIMALYVTFWYFLALSVSFGPFTLFCRDFAFIVGVFWHTVALFVTFGDFRHFLGPLGLLCCFVMNSLLSQFTHFFG